MLQMKSHSRRMRESTDTILQQMRQAAAHGADLFLLPEAFLTGYGLPMTNEEALPEDSPCCRKYAAKPGCCAWALW